MSRDEKIDILQQTIGDNPHIAMAFYDGRFYSWHGNSLFRSLFNLTGKESLEDSLGKIFSLGSLKKVVSCIIESDEIFELETETSKNEKHLKLQVFRGQTKGIVSIYAHDLKEVDELSFQLREYTEGLVKNAVGLELSQRELEKRNQELEDELKTRELAQALLRESLDNQERIVNEMIKTLSLIGILKDPYTGHHQQRVAVLARSIAQEMNLHHQQIQGIYVAGMLHDIGKITVPSEILSKPGGIRKEEMNLIRTHPIISYEILNQVEFPWPVAMAAYQHHEKLDGSGYPLGIKGDDIILEAKIIAVADITEAISSHRPYREGLGIEKALSILEEEKGKSLDASIVDVCLFLFREKSFTFDDPYSFFS